MQSQRGYARGGLGDDSSRFGGAAAYPQPPAAISVLRAAYAAAPSPTHSPSPPSRSPLQQRRRTRAKGRGGNKHTDQQQHDAADVQASAFEWQQQQRRLSSTRAPAVAVAAPQSHRQLFAAPQQQPVVDAVPVPPLHALLAPSPPPSLAHASMWPLQLQPQPQPQTQPQPLAPQQHMVRALWTSGLPREEKEDPAVRKQLASIQLASVQPPSAAAYDASQQQLLYLQQLWAQHHWLQQQPQSYHQLQSSQSQPHSQRSVHRPASSAFVGGSSPRPSADPAAVSQPRAGFSHKAQALTSSTTKQAAAAAAFVVAHATHSSKRSSLPTPQMADPPQINRAHRAQSRPGTSGSANPAATPSANSQLQHQSSRAAAAAAQSSPHRSSSHHHQSLLQSSSSGGSSDDEEFSAHSETTTYARNGHVPTSSSSSSSSSHFPMPPPSARQQPRRRSSDASDEDEDSDAAERHRHCETGSLDLSLDEADDALGSGSASPTAGGGWSHADESFVDQLAASFNRCEVSAGSMQQQSAFPSARPTAMRTMSSTGSRPFVAAPAASSSRPGSSSHRTPHSHSRRASELQNRVAALLAQQQTQQQPQSPTPRPKSTSGYRPHGVNFKPRIGSAPQHRLLQQQQQRRPQSSGMLSPRGASNAAATQEAAVIFASSATSPADDAFPARSPALHARSSDDPLLPPPGTLCLSRSCPFFRRLPDELWGEIMSLLGGDASSLLCVVSRLNREAARAVRDPEWWRHVHLGPGFAARLVIASSKDAAALTAERGDRLHPELSQLRSGSGSSASFLSRLLSLSARWTWLESLDLSGVGAALTDDFFAALTASTRRSGSNNSAGGESAARFWSRTLHTLSLARCTQLTDATLAALAPCALALQRLDLSGLALVTDEGFAAFLAHIGGGGGGAGDTRGGGGRGGRGRGRGVGCMLVQLKLNRCYGLGDGALQALARHAPRLQDLDLTFCNRVTDAGLAALASLGSRERDLKGGSSSSSTREATPGLRQLSLRWCRSITDAGVRSLFSPDGADDEDHGGLHRAMAVAPQSFSVLSYLNVDHCALLTDDSVACIAAHAFGLQQLSMVFCKQLTPRALQLLFHAARPLPSLRTVVLDHCDLLGPLFAPHVAAGPLRFAPGSSAAAASRSLPALSLLSCRCCPHAGMERSRHSEIEAECCPGFVVLAPSESADATGAHLRACMSPSQRTRFVADLARLS